MCYGNNMSENFRDVLVAPTKSGGLNYSIIEPGMSARLPAGRVLTAIDIDTLKPTIDAAIREWVRLVELSNSGTVVLDRKWLDKKDFALDVGFPITSVAKLITIDSQIGYVAGNVMWVNCIETDADYANLNKRWSTVVGHEEKHLQYKSCIQMRPRCKMIQFFLKKSSAYTRVDCHVLTLRKSYLLMQPQYHYFFLRKLNRVRD